MQIFTPSLVKYSTKTLVFHLGEGYHTDKPNCEIFFIPSLSTLCSADDKTKKTKDMRAGVGQLCKAEQPLRAMALWVRRMGQRGRKV